MKPKTPKFDFPYIKKIGLWQNLMGLVVLAKSQNQLIKI
jgi:hypothetical protein